MKNLSENKKFQKKSLLILPPWTMLCGFRIRTTLLLIISLLSLIATLALFWNTFYVFERKNDADQFVWVNTILKRTLSLDTLLAQERGFTIVLLANPEHLNAESQQRLFDIRAKVDQSLYLLQDDMETAPNPLSSVVKKLLKDLPQAIISSRRRVNLSLNQKEAAITANEWAVEISQSIDDISKINSLIRAPINTHGHVTSYGITTKDSFSAISQNLGQERALIGRVLAENRPFLPQEQQKLSNFQYATENILISIDKVLINFPKNQEIILARLRLQQAYTKGYQALRDAIIQSSQNGQAYPISSIEWFEQATKGINSILNVSTAIDLYVENGIKLITADTKQKVTAAFITLTLVAVVFILAFKIVQRRILIPLSQLELSAKRIANDDFSSALNMSGNDEFSEVAEAFELMRSFLVDDRHKRDTKAENERLKLNTAIEQSASSIVIKDLNKVVEYVNPQFYRTTGYAPDEVIGRKMDILKSGENLENNDAVIWQTLNDGKVWHGELLNKKKSGELFWEMVTISPVYDQNHKITHFISIQHDISKRKALEENLHFMAYYDKLTGLPNRALFEDRFMQMVAQAKRTKSKVALIILDLDHFKVINDSLGHHVGDLLLIEAAKRLKETMRSCDTLARYGGDEFVMLIDNAANINTLVTLLTRLMEALQTHLVIAEQEMHVSASFGISIYPDDGEDLGTLLKKADSAMYYAKEAGRNQFQFFTSEMNKKTNERLRLEGNLRKAIEHQEMELYYQPQVCFKSGKLIGVEALIRWNHSEFGLISPFQFIPLAEEIGVIKSIGKWVLQTACAQLMKWSNEGHKGLSMAVNTSVRELEDANFIPTLKAILEETGIEPSALEIEVTESVVMSHPDKMLKVLKAIKTLGVKLALDDFGTGYSSLSYLKNFPFDKLKIDRSFIQDVAEKPEDVIFTQAITQMAHALNIKVLVEGVETRTQATLVRSCDCDEMQGYLVSKPVPASEFGLLFDHSDTYDQSDVRQS